MEYANNGGEKCKPVFLQSEKNRVFPYYMYRYMLYLQSIPLSLLYNSSTTPLPLPYNSLLLYLFRAIFIPCSSLAYPLLKFFHLPLSPHDLRVG